MRNKIIKNHFGDVAYIISKYDYFIEGVVDKVLKGHTNIVKCVDVLSSKDGGQWIMG